MEVKKARRNINISYLRIAATLAVLWLHTVSIFGTITELNSEMLHFFDFVKYIMTWAVPVFFMITGNLMLNPKKEITTSQFISKYALRVTVALFLFGIPLSMIIIFFEEKALSIQLILKSVIAVFTGDSFAHLWYLYVLIGLYLLMPVIKEYVKNAKQKDLLITMVILFLFDYILPTITSLTGIRFEFSLPFTYPIFYLLAGYYIGEYKPKLLCKKWVNMVVLIVFALILLFFVYNDITLAGFLYDGLFTGLASISVYSLFIACSDGNKQTNSELIWKIDRLCFGVYLVHPVFMQFTYRVINLTPVSFEAYYVAFIPFFIFFTLCSFFVSWIMSLIKPLKKYVL